MDFTNRPNIVNAEFIKLHGGEMSFVIAGAEEYKTKDDKTLKCLRLQEADGQTILFNPNATARRALNEAGLFDSDQMVGYRLVLHLVKVSMGSEEVDGVRIKEIQPPTPPEKKQAKRTQTRNVP